MIKIRAAGVLAALALTTAIPFSAHAAQGLNGSYYTTPDESHSLKKALSQISSEKPVATFTANTVCFPSCGKLIKDSPATIADFLGGNATDITPNGVNDVSNHVVILTGYFYAAAAGDYTFDLQSDDGSELLLNNKLVVDNDGNHNFQGETGAVFLGKGWQSIEIVQFEDSGDAGLTLDVNNTPLGGNLLSTTPVPEPATWAMLIVGVAMIGFAARRRREGMVLAA